MWSPDLYARAISFAAGAHGNQRVPGTEHPYVIHPATVCAEVIGALRVEQGLDEDVAVACALLHDVVEDTPRSIEDVEKAFGPAIATGVLALTKNEHLPKPEQMDDSLRRIKACSRAIWLVKLADRTVNMDEPPHYWSAEKRAKYRDEARLILATLGAASEHLSKRLQARIDVYPG